MAGSNSFAVKMSPTTGLVVERKHASARTCKKQRNDKNTNSSGASLQSLFSTSHRKSPCSAKYTYMPRSKRIERDKIFLRGHNSTSKTNVLLFLSRQMTPLIRVAPSQSFQYQKINVLRDSGQQISAD